MLLNLHVKNVALLDDVEIDFGKGLNILTGETGAGKSLLIDSVNFALGKRMPKDVVREDSEYALCELCFSVDNPAVKTAIEELDIPVADNEVILQRKIMKGRSILKVNGETVTATVIKEIASLLIDIHGQHEHQSLLYKSKHKLILDEYAGEELKKVLSVIKEEYAQYSSVLNELEAAKDSDKSKDKELDLAKFEIEEIERAAIKANEFEELEAEYRKLGNSKKIAESISAVHQMCGYDLDGAGGSIGRALSRLSSVADYDDDINSMVAELTDIDSVLNDFNRSLASYEDNLDVSPERFAEVEERLNMLNHIRNKYGDTYEAINEYLADKQALVEKYSNFEEYIKKLQDSLSELKCKLITDCEKASKIRVKTAEALQSQIKDALKDLNFLDANFNISVTADEKYLSAAGYDDVEFLISTNPGEKIKPLTEVASGGELSRIMLALKSVIAKKDNVETLIFDEIDTGISGRTAQMVSTKLKELSGERQIICITHLPQIAAMADEHFEISKEVVNERTRTNVVALSEEDSVRELARMLGGVEITENVINNAREMKILAKDLKK